MKTQTLTRTLTLALLALGFTAQADVVTDWNSAALGAMRGNRTPPPRASRNLAILHASMYDAVNGIDRKHRPYLVEDKAPSHASAEAAASAAARKVLLALFPTNAPAFDTLHSNILAGLPKHPKHRVKEIARGIEWGERVATDILAFRANDGSAAVVTPPPAVGPGDWVPTPAAFAPFLLPQWGGVMPFSMENSAQFRPPGPPALDSLKYATDFNEVKALGAAVGSMRTADQTEIALFWADGAGTETPPGHWNHIAQDVAGARKTSLEENARLFALLNLAMADAAICAWDAKYTFHNWRPVTAIRMADVDGNAGTELDAAWSSLIGTPPFPEYVSGHSTFSGAAAIVLAMFHGKDKIAFTTGSDALPGVTRSFTSFSGAALEAMNSRLYGGIHFRFANEDGLDAGLQIGEWTVRHYLTKGKGKQKEKGGHTHSHD